MAGKSNSSTLQTAKAELVDLQSEQQREMEGLLDNVRSMTRELRLQMLAIDSFVPADYQVRIRIKGESISVRRRVLNFQELIESNVQWNEDIGEWQLKCVAYTGNNMRKRYGKV